MASGDGISTMQDGASGEEAIRRRLHALGSACAALAVVALATATVVGRAAVQASSEDWMTSAPGNAFLAALCGMLLVLLASAAHGRVLRRQVDAELARVEEAEEEDEVEVDEVEEDEVEGMGMVEESDQVPAEEVVAARLRAFAWATGTCFGMLTVAAVLGALATAGGRAPLLGLVVCVSVLFAMKARWPSREAFERAFEAAPPARGAGGRAGGARGAGEAR